jgi:hypothetical protein
MRRSLSILAALAVAACGGAQVATGTVGSVSGPSGKVDRVVAAVRSVDAVYADPRFWELVKRRAWLAEPDSTVVTPGEEVAAILSAVRPSEQRYVLQHLGWSRVPFKSGGTYGSTSACVRPAADSPQCGLIRINKKRVDDPVHLVNTIAHEVSHTVGIACSGMCRCAGNLASRYLDTPAPSESVLVWLVSYALGDLAQCFHQHRGDEVKTLRCFDGTVNASRMNRIELECSAQSPLPADLHAQLKAAMGRCPAAAM